MHMQVNELKSVIDHATILRLGHTEGQFGLRISMADVEGLRLNMGGGERHSPTGYKIHGPNVYKGAARVI